MHEKQKNNKEEGVMNVVLKIDLHCNGCAEKIYRSVKRFEGVKKVWGDMATNKLTVSGKVDDPVKLKAWIESKTNKKADLISPQQPKMNNNNNNNNNNKSEKKTKEVQGPTVVLKTPLHCQGCIEKMQKLINKTKGVQEVSIDTEKETVTVKGTMDVKVLQACLQDKLKRAVVIVPPKNDKTNSGGGGDEKNKKDSSGSGFGGGGGGAEASGWGVFSRSSEYNNNNCYYGGPPMYVYAPQYFSEENPNACSVM
ncbi:hypothetical protein Sjap_021625 [Stephania japonica]|uniref:HMA domain-containing protein n=1 Tax=Stephania japonica TaxID=461633 RepID=A0AAP0EUI4_9MAGN